MPVNYTKTIHIDNQQPTVSLTGPADAPSTAGTQYVTAAATAGPSGVAGISCAVDGGTAKWYASATAQVPVSGVGEHTVQCFSESNARDGSGTPGVSAMRSFAMSIRVPTVSGIAFTAIADRLRCKRDPQADQGARTNRDRPPPPQARADPAPSAHQGRDRSPNATRAQSSNTGPSS